MRKNNLWSSASSFLGTFAALCLVLIVIAEPALAQEEPQVISEAYIQSDPGPAPTPPTGVTLIFAQTFQDLSRTQIGTMWWINQDWGVGLNLGFKYANREFLSTGLNGRSNRVTRVSTTILPQLTGAYTIATANTKRLIVSAGVGPYFVKPEGGDVQTGFAAHVGPGIDWPLSTQLSLHLEQWVGVISDPDPARGLRVALQPQISAIWWFE